LATWARSDRRVKRPLRGQRQFEPLAASQIAPVEPMPLALLAQRASPLQFDFAENPVQLLLAMMQPEVLVEPAEHGLQMALLVAPFPVHVLDQPLVGAGEELATALHAGESNHGKSSAAIGSANMFKTEKLEGLRSLTVLRAPLRGESAKEQQPSLLFGQLEVKSCEAVS